MGSFPFPINDGITVQASNQAPTADAGGPYTGNEGQEITLNGSGSTDTDGTISVYSWTYEVVTADPGASCSLTSANTASPKITCNDDGSYKVKLTVTDDDGAPDDAEATLTLANVGPTATFSAPTPVNEGSPISLSFSSPQDAANDVAAGFTYAFDCGDGAGYGTFGSGTSASCPTTDNGSRTVKGKIKDKDAGETEYTAIVTVNNVAPDIASPLTKPDGSALPISITVGATVAFKASFTDPGTGDTHNAEITCSPTSSVIGGGAVTQPSFQGSCTFTTVGSKTISVKVTDDDGDFDVETYNISVLYDFRGFFSPVDNPGPYNTMNVANAGQAIPLKWQLLDYAGNPVTNLIGVNVTAVTLTCSLGTTTDLLEEYAAGSSGLQNLGNGFYQFNWKTPTGYARSCKTMNLDLGEGTPRIALFQFRK
jgi:hypothetical protein